MESKSLEQVIRQFIALPPMSSGSGWYPVLHSTCDKGHKGPRAGFKFDGDTTAFHCFNCGMSTVYDPSTHKSMPKKMVEVLHDFNIPDTEWQSVVFHSMANKDKLTLKESQKTSIEPEEIDLPNSFYPLSSAKMDDPWAEIAKYYLKEERNIDPYNYPFYLSKPSDHPGLKKWQGRLIIPVYKQKKLIFYQGRDLTGKKQKKYESPSVSRDRVMYGFDKLFDNSNQPLYIVEGIFDAMLVDGVAILGNELSKPQIEWLNRSHKTKVYIPDRFGDGARAATIALNQGWGLSFIEAGNDVKDVSDAVRKYGKLYTIKSLIDNTCFGFEAKVKLGIYVK